MLQAWVRVSEHGLASENRKLKLVGHSRDGFMGSYSWGFKKGSRVRSGHDLGYGTYTPRYSEPYLNFQVGFEGCLVWGSEFIGVRAKP